ncbi:MAG: RsmD family RNA methyltransferase [Deltaproteobacteria bacterium]|nr:RsmD family RNA methyltransferase [Deltaproteobacteria bacterium]
MARQVSGTGSRASRLRLQALQMPNIACSLPAAQSGLQALAWRSMVARMPPARIEILLGDNLPLLARFEDSAFDLIYIDPPFNTGKTQERTRLRTVADPQGGDRVGFGGRRYRSQAIGRSGFEDAFDDYLDFLAPRLEQAHRVLAPTGSFFLHIDYREVHYCKVLLDAIFGRDCFQNEIIWAYDFGGRSKTRWSAKHDNILWYTRDPKSYTFDFEAMDRIPYMAPGLAGKDKAARGKTPTDVWWHTIVPTHGRERTGYATQKPLGIIERIVKVHSKAGDRLLDFFAGSGTLGEAAARLGRSAVLIDSSPEAIRVMQERLAFADARVVDAGARG